MHYTRAARASVPLRVATVLALGTIVLLAVPTPGHASHYLVDAAGGGDFRSIQPALDTLVAAPRDSILIAPGEYPDTLKLPALGSTVVVGGIGPAVSQRLRTLSGAGYASWTHWRFARLTFTEFFDRERLGGAYQDGYAFSECTFERGFAGHGSGSSEDLANCTFLDRTWLLGYTWPGFVGLHFIRAPLITDTQGAGDANFTDCTFEGPTDTLIHAYLASTNNINFARCTFDSARFGIVVVSSIAVGCNISASRFHDIEADAIRLVDWTPDPRSHDYTPWLGVTRSSFDRCGTAARWTSSVSLGWFMASDTIRDCASDAIVTTPSGAMDHVLVTGSGGSGLLAEARPILGAPMFTLDFAITNCEFSRNRSDGIRLRDTLLAGPIGTRSMWTVRNTTSHSNGGVGLWAEGANCRLIQNVAHHNGADGIVLVAALPADSAESYDWRDSVVSNTSVANAGDGIRVERRDLPGVYVQVVERNLSVANQGAGLIRPLPPRGALAFNDVFRNVGGDFYNALASRDSNLSAEPQLCDLQAGALTLSGGSICGPSGPYGLIGARPEGCASPASAGGAVASLGFSVFPNPASAEVQFALPPLSTGLLEVLDIQGRVVWRQPVRAGERTVRWSGRSERGDVQPGLYWARLSSPIGATSRRLVWMR